ncbi:ribonuclease III [bacterium]|nr:ribonuclease III [bacterium]
MGMMWWLKRLFRRDRLPFNIEAVESAIGYHFVDTSLLYISLKHRSYSQAIDGNVDLSNERLEFLGDSVLNMIVSHFLFMMNPSFQEGELTKLKSALVSKTSAAVIGKRIGLDRFILLSDSEEGSGGRKRISLIADTYEAIIGAIYLDGGIEASRAFIRTTMLDEIDYVLGEVQKNYKSLLLEYTQAKKLGHPVYKTVSAEGPDHDKMFTVEVFIKDRSYGIGKGKNKKSAQQKAAEAGLAHLMKRSRKTE